MLIVKWLARWIEPMVLRCQQRTHSMDLRYLLYVWKKPYIRDPSNLCEKQGFDFMLGREDDLGLGDPYQNFQSIFHRLNVDAVASCCLRWRCCTFTHQKNAKKLLTSLALPGATGQAEYREAQATLKMDMLVLFVPPDENHSTSIKLTAFWCNLGASWENCTGPTWDFQLLSAGCNRLFQER